MHQQKVEAVKIKRINIFMVCFVIALFIGLAPASASTATGVSITSTTVSAHGWNSCGGWFKTGGTFQNYCPFCHRTGSLRWNPKGTSEGEFTCTCDADYCICGRCKAGGSGVHLIKASASGDVVKKSPSPVSNPVSSTGTTDTIKTSQGIIIGAGIGAIIKQLKTPWSVI